MTTCRIPEHGVDKADVLGALNKFKNGDADWKGGKVWSLVYHLDDDYSKFLKEAYGVFFSENGLSPIAFPSLKRLETEVVAMTAGLLGGDESTVGTMTSGGSESLLMAVKTARDWARAEKPHIKSPEMIMPVSAHPGLWKGAHYFDVKPVLIPVTGDFRADVKAAEAAINANTIMMVGSAPSYPQGVIDPIPELAALAKRNGLWFHVDACLGGFMLPWLKMLGH
ncbi:MAG: aminotransferase class V-fold PLP-dependent enzyme, partial [Myxococcota bacterium]